MPGYQSTDFPVVAQAEYIPSPVKKRRLCILPARTSERVNYFSSTQRLFFTADLFTTGSNTACAIGAGHIAVIVDEHVRIFPVEIIPLAKGKNRARVHIPHLRTSIPARFYFTGAAAPVAVNLVSVIAFPPFFGCSSN
jgi:hypothetical protein